MPGNYHLRSNFLLPLSMKRAQTSLGRSKAGCPDNAIYYFTHLIFFFLSLKKETKSRFVPSAYRHQKLSRSAHLSWCLGVKRLLLCTWEEAEGNSVELDREDELCPNQRIPVPANDLRPRTSGSSKQVSRWIFVFTLEVYTAGLLKGNGTVEMKPD